MSETKGPGPFQKWERSPVPQNEAIRPLEPSAAMISHAINDFCHSDHTTRFHVIGREAALSARPSINRQRCVDKERTSVVRGPRSIFNVFGPLCDQIGPGLAYRQYLQAQLREKMNFRIIAQFVNSKNHMSDEVALPRLRGFLASLSCC
jgi:hypothetical protein